MKLQTRVHRRHVKSLSYLIHLPSHHAAPTTPSQHTSHALHPLTPRARLTSMTRIMPVTYRWQRYPANTSLPTPLTSSFFDLKDGSKLWYAVYNAPLSAVSKEVPLLFLHGGLCSSLWFAHQVQQLCGRTSRPIVSLDTRGHGRSTDNSAQLGYALLTDDTVALLDHLGIARVAVVGWSDGGIISTDLAMRYPGRLDRAFCFAGSIDVNSGGHSSSNANSDELMERLKTQYEQLNPVGEWKPFKDKVYHMFKTEPTWTKESFEVIPTPARPGKDGHVPLLWFVGADHDEAVRPSEALQMSQWVDGSVSLLLPGVSHFAMVQDPETFSNAILQFLEAKRPWEDHDEAEKPQL